MIKFSDIKRLGLLLLFNILNGIYFCINISIVFIIIWSELRSVIFSCVFKVILKFRETKYKNKIASNMCQCVCVVFLVLASWKELNKQNKIYFYFAQKIHIL